MTRAALPALGALLLLTGCHSATILATLHNDTGKEMRLVEVDYPSASFGIGTIAPGASYNYRFKVLGSGALKLTYLDVAGKEHTANGPELHEGLEGPLLINVSSEGVQWKPSFNPAH